MNILSALLTPLIAILAVYIAWQQWMTSRDKLRLDLYDKRYAVYKAIMLALSEIIQNANIKRESINKLNVDTNECNFLFDSDVVDYIEEFRDKATKLQTKTMMLDDRGLPIGDKRTALASECDQLLEWFSEQFKASRIMFQDYLRFRK